jgi:tetratricopeptide (TPR) repeat protein
MHTRGHLVVVKIGCAGSLACILFCLVSCDRMMESRMGELIKDGDALAAAGDYQKAISRYETALDGTPQSADIHYRLALIYDDKLNDPVNALHHFRRYLTLAPKGSHASDATSLAKRDELALVTSLSGDSVVPRTEATRLRNENLSLRKQLDDERAKVAAPAESKTRRASPVKSRKSRRR